MPPKTIRFNPIVLDIEYARDATPALSYSSLSNHDARPRQTPSPVIMHPALRPSTCAPLDLSLPSAVLRADPRLDPKLLTKPACTPPRTRAVTIRVAATASPRGLCAFPVSHVCDPAAGASGSITVGDVLNTIHDTLRQRLPPASNASSNANTNTDAERYRAHRVRTLPLYLDDLDPAARRQLKSAEVTAGVRRVDLLHGAVRFDGVVPVVKSTQSRGGVEEENEVWLVDLQPAERYADV